MKQFFKDLTVSMFSGLIGRIFIPALCFFAAYLGFTRYNEYIATDTNTTNSAEMVSSVDIERNRSANNELFSLIRYAIRVFSNLFCLILGVMFGSGLIFDIFRWIKERQSLKIKELELKVELEKLQQNSTNNKDIGG